MGEKETGPRGPSLLSLGLRDCGRRSGPLVPPLRLYSGGRAGSLSQGCREIRWSDAAQCPHGARPMLAPGAGQVSALPSYGQRRRLCRLMKRVWCSPPGTLGVVRWGSFSQGPQRCLSIPFHRQPQSEVRTADSRAGVKVWDSLSPKSGLIWLRLGAGAVGGFYDQRLSSLTNNGFLYWSWSYISPFGKGGTLLPAEQQWCPWFQPHWASWFITGSELCQGRVWTAWSTVTSSGPDAAPGT